MATFPDDKRWDVHLDKKWRLNIPATILKKLNIPVVFIREGENGCLQILQLNNPDPLSFQVKLGMHEGKPRRITIPQELRDSQSFYFGRKVTIAGKGDHLEVWPRH